MQEEHLGGRVKIVPERAVAIWQPRLSRRGHKDGGHDGRRPLKRTSAMQDTKVAEFRHEASSWRDARSVLWTRSVVSRPFGVDAHDDLAGAVRADETGSLAGLD